MVVAELDTEIEGPFGGGTGSYWKLKKMTVIGTLQNNQILEGENAY